MKPTESRSRPSSNPRPNSDVRDRSIRQALAVVGGAAALISLGVLPCATLRAQQAPGDTRQIVIGEGSQRFAVPDCIPRRADAASAEACATITQVLRNDIRFEGLFQFVPESLVKSIPAQNPDSPNFLDWQGISAKILVMTRAEVVGADLTVEVKAYFVDSGQTMLSRRYSGKSDNPRIFAHQASDDIMERTQYKGVARSKITFTSDRDSKPDHRSKEIYIVDYDGFNPRRLTVNGSLNILPTWSPDGRSLLYVSYRQGQPVIFRASIFEGKSTANVTGEKNSQAFAPAQSPDGKRIAFASNRGGSMDIWVANIDGTSPRRLTQSAAADTAPCWSPTGQEIAFTSSRTGSPQIWVMDSEGLNVRRLTTVGNYNDACAWSPGKDSEIAYTSRLESGGFDIAVIDLASRQVRQVTQGRGSCEYPTWAPNGRHLAFSCNRGGQWQINVANRDGSTIQSLAAGPGNNVQPDWGP